ncbi:MAG: GNAT family N-acetyltransferase [Bacteroidales bacterium]|nr:GNAT family N-acetyltransferase [Bacteroidales bacterium]
MEKTVYFRALEDEDAVLIHQWKNDDELNAYTIGLNKKTCYEEELEWVRAHKMYHPYSAYWAICAKDTGKMVGWACLTNIHYINSSAETGAIVIGDPQYRDGYAWIETILFMLEYAFERLNLNRLYGKSILGHKSSNMVEELMFMPREGLLRQAAYKNGRFYDVSYAAILRDEYYAHKNAGDYEMPAIIRRLKQLRKSSK